VRGLGVLQFGVGSGLQHSTSLLMRMNLVTALQTSFSAVPANWVPYSTYILRRTTQHHAECVMNNTEKRRSVPDCWQFAALSKV